MIGILGGTGPLGRGLARRFAVAGETIVLGSRDAARAEAAAQELRTGLPDVDPDLISGGDNAVAARADVVIVAVPYAGHADLLGSLAEALTDRLVIDCVNPLGFDQRGPYRLEVADGSAAEEAARLLPGSRVVAGFHHLSAELLADPAAATLDCDVLVLGENRDDVAAAIAVAELIPGVTGRYGGRLRNAAQVEALTANLIAINRRYGAHSGIRITGIADTPAEQR